MSYRRNKKRNKKVMDNVIIYSRVSTDEQREKGFSLRDQVDKLEKYCQAKNYSILEHFQDDYSAKTFNRPAFQQFLIYAKNNKGKITRLVFIKWDRFSRNATDALLMIRQLSAMGIVCDAIEQPLDLSIPENKLLLLIYLGAPEIENDRRSLNTTNGMRRAQKEGRYCNNSPFGYKYYREGKKPILIPNEPKASLIREAFELFATGQFSKEEIRRLLRPKGMTLEKTRFTLIFHNPIYCGKIFLKAYKDEVEEIVDGVHEALVSEEIYTEVQLVASGVKKIQSKPKNQKEELPLRGFLSCPNCGRNLTGSASKSRRGTRHFYYHCRLGCPTRFRANEVNKAFENWLDHISLKPEHHKQFLRTFEALLHTQKGERKRLSNVVEEKLGKIKTELLEAGKMLVRKEIDSETFQQLKASYTEEEKQLKLEQTKLFEIDQDILVQIEFGLKVMSNLRNLWLSLGLQEKQTLISAVFSEKIIYENGECRTLNQSYPFDEILNDTNDIESMENKKTAISDGFSSTVARRGVEHLHPEAFILALNSIY